MPRVVPSQVVALIDQLFPWASSQGAQGQEPPKIDGGQAASLAAVLDLIDRIPGELLILDGAAYSGFIANVAAIRHALAIWRQLGASASTITSVKGFKKLSPVTVIRRALQACPDEIVPASTVGLAFIPDLDLRQSLRQDIAAAETALRNGEWKAATVLAGSVVEALLLWALQQRTAVEIATAVASVLAKKALAANPSADLESWTLAQYIEAAAELQIVGSETATAARLAKSYRNLIHPGRASRLGQKCDRGTALSAVAAVEHVVRDLTP